MLRVPKHRRPPPPPGLSGRFLPLDADDERLLDELARGRHMPGGRFADDGGSEKEKEAWSNRSEAAKKRWADPTYRAMMLTKRRRKKAAEGKVRIGSMDSVTLSGDEKAREINDYVRSCKRRSESLEAFHRDGAGWMKRRLEEGEGIRRGREAEGLAERQKRRKAVARKRHEDMRRARREGEGGKDVVAPPKKRGRPPTRATGAREGDG